ncbi:MAG: hypothetical protein IJ689_05920 [Alphaproteobacteria bacterium]|nr:hypothetical protein [Alphaproteobacteria bacterium]
MTKIITDLTYYTLKKLAKKQAIKCLKKAIILKSCEKFGDNLRKKYRKSGKYN